MAVDPRKFLLNTDYEMDKIIYFKDGSLDAGQLNVSIPHNLGFAPLIFGTCAFSSNFSDPHSIPLEQSTSTGTVQFTAFATSSDIRVSYFNTTGSSNKIYYRLFGFEPDGSNRAISPTAKHAKKFVLNTDYNYCKLFKKGSVDGKTNTNIAHNLGYIPQVLVWAEMTDYQGNRITFPITVADWTTIDGSQTISGVVVTNSLVRFEESLYQYDKIHYRIYYDEA